MCSTIYIFNHFGNLWKREESELIKIARFFAVLLNIFSGVIILTSIALNGFIELNWVEYFIWPSMIGHPRSLSPVQIVYSASSHWCGIWSVVLKNFEFLMFSVFVFGVFLSQTFHYMPNNIIQCMGEWHLLACLFTYIVACPASLDRHMVFSLHYSCVSGCKEVVL